MGLVATLALLATACGSSGNSTEVASSDDGVSASDSADEMSMTDEMSDMDEMSDIDGGHDMDEMSDIDDGHDHDHSEMTLTEWGGDTAPTVAIDVMAQEGGEVRIDLTLDGFTLLEDGGNQTTLTEGHVHIAVDGTEYGMFFEPQIALTGVAAGPHQVTATLSAPDHSTYAIDGQPLAFTEPFTVPGEVASADTVIAVVVDADGKVADVVDATASVGDTVQLTVDSPVDEEVHVHAYDLMVDVQAGEPADVQFTADIPGVFEIELENSSVLVAKLTVS